MKRSEAMAKLPIEVTCDTVEFVPNHGSKLSMRCLDRDGNTVHHSVVEGYYSRQVLAARDLLHAEDDAGDDLQWNVELHSSPSGQRYYPNALVARCNTESSARHMVKFWGSQHTTITGPTQTVDHGEQKPTESKCIPAFQGDPDDCAFKHPPRLVPVTPTLPTLDMMPEGKEYRCVRITDTGNEGHVQLRANVKGKGWLVTPSGEPKYPGSEPDASRYRVLDADHPTITPKTVGELEPGMVICDGGIWRISYKNGYLTELATGSISIWPTDTTITGPVYRFDVTD